MALSLTAVEPRKLPTQILIGSSVIEIVSD